MTPRQRAARLTDADVRAAWKAATPEPFAEDGISVERAMEEAGIDVFALFAVEAPALWLGDYGGDLVVVGEGEDGPMFVTLKDDGPTVAMLRRAVEAVSDALAVAAEPHDAATREAATKADHALGFALDDLRVLRR